MLHQQLYSPLIFSLSDPVFPHIDITANRGQVWQLYDLLLGRRKQYNGQDYSFLSSCGSSNPQDEVVVSISRITTTISTFPRLVSRYGPDAIRLLSRAVPSSPSLLTPWK